MPIFGADLVAIHNIMPLLAVFRAVRVFACYACVLCGRMCTRVCVCVCVRASVGACGCACMRAFACA